MTHNDSSLEKVLKQIDFLAETSESYLNKITRELIEVSFEPGEYILKEGRQGGSFFFLLEGTISIWTTDIDGELQKIATVEAPSYFGELALLHEQNRNASIKTETRVQASMLCKEAFKDLILGNPKIKNNLIKFSTQRLDNT